MKALMKTKKEPGLELRDVPIPEPQRGEVLIRVKRSAICGSDLAIYNFVPPATDFLRHLPLIPGHECVGEVVAVGEGVHRVRVGDRVAGETHIPCGHCWQCRNGRAHTCEHMLLFGHHVHGAFAEYAVLPESAVFPVPDFLSDEAACLLEPMGIPYRAATFTPKESVLVLGCGPIGQFACAFSKALGARIVFAADPKASRRALAEKMGADVLLDPERENLSQAIQETIPEERGVGVIIEASGSSRALREALSCLRTGGTLVLLGHIHESLPLEISRGFIQREIRVLGLFGRVLWETWEEVVKLLAENPFTPETIVTHRFPLEAYEEAFQVAQSREGCKILFIPS